MSFLDRANWTIDVQLEDEELPTQELEPVLDMPAPGWVFVMFQSEDPRDDGWYRDTDPVVLEIMRKANQ